MLINVNIVGTNTGGGVTPLPVLPRKAGYVKSVFKVVHQDDAMTKSEASS